MRYLFTMTKKIMVFTLVVVMCISTITGCKKNDSNKFKNLEKVVLTMDDKKLTLQDLMYSIYLVESNGEQNEQLYQSYFQTSYWDEEEDGVTYRELAKDDVIEMAKWYEVVYETATAAGYKLTAEESTANETAAEDMLADIEDEKEKQLGFSKEYLLENLEKEAIVLRYQSDKIASYKLDEEAIKAEIKYDEYKQYEIDYICGETVEYDEAGNVTAFTDEQIEEVRSKIADVMVNVKAGQEFESLVSEDDQTLLYGSTFMSYNGEDGDEAILAVAKNLKNGEVYQELVEAQDGLYIIKMINTESTEAYDAAVDEAIIAAGEDAFNEEYEKMLEGYTVSVDEAVWKEIVLGNITITPSELDATLEDPNAEEIEMEDSEVEDAVEEDSEIELETEVQE